MKLSRRFVEKCEWFERSNDAKRFEPIPLSPDGHSARECFFARESFGQTLPCREPEALAVLLNGKEWHGVTVKMVAEDLLCGLAFVDEVIANYPAWVAREILRQSAKISVQTIGFVPSFLRV